MNEYKFLREFDEIVPGMLFEIFESEDRNRIKIVSKTNRNCLRELWINYTLEGDGQIRSDNMMHMGDKFKLIYDPRQAPQKSTQEKIAEHKKQIEILEKELQKESLKNVFSKDQYYKIKTKDDTFICKFGMSDFDNNSIWIERVDRYTKKISTDDIQKVWHVENLKHVFGFCETVFERKD